MSKNPKKPIIYAFIDSQNLNLGTSKSFTNRKVKYIGWKLDYKKFLHHLKGKYHVKKAFLFIGYIFDNQSLYKYLQDCGYILIFKPTLEKTEGNKVVVKGNIDAELVLHAMIEKDNYDQAIIVSGDGDFHCLHEHLASQNKLQKIFIPNKYSFSSLLRKFTRYFIYVTELRESLQKKERDQRSE